MPFLPSTFGPPFPRFMDPPLPGPLHLPSPPPPLSLSPNTVPSEDTEVAAPALCSHSALDRLIAARQLFDSLSTPLTEAPPGRERVFSGLVIQSGPAWLRANVQRLVNEHAVFEAAHPGCPQCQSARNQGPGPTTGCGLSPSEGTGFHRTRSIKPTPFISLNRTSTGRGGSKLQFYW